ncbi:MAG: MFS transporter [Candidatus Pacebacteria bacterium]|nr:MFS transporter [Candidatus Paceibacterota bacterium]
MPRVTSRSEHGKMLKHRYIPLYIASLALMFHGFVIAYLNSSFLERFISTEGVGTIYIITSALTVLVFLFISRVLHKVGNFKLTLGLLVLNGLAVFGIAFAETMRVAIPLMATHLIIITLIVFNLDIFMEEHIGNDEGVTGTRRGLLLTLMSAIGALSPFIASELIAYTNGDFTLVYVVSALSLLPIIAILLIYFKDFQDPPYNDIKVLEALRGFWVKKDIRAVLCVHFVLQMFFMCMVVFTPLYLIQHIGLSWAQFGVIMLFGQFAYVLFEYPIGVIADRYIGEKEMMALGLMILAISTAWISFVGEASVLLWILVMFTTRVGASFVEVTTEVHFFKHTNSSDAQIISFFRVTRPLAYLAGAIVASIALLYLPFNLLFVVFAFLMIPAMFMTFSIEDTR